jgi:hypothetical protein
LYLRRRRSAKSDVLLGRRNPCVSSMPFTVTCNAEERFGCRSGWRRNRLLLLLI